MEYYFNELDPTSFQRLINGILIPRFGEAISLTPLRGPDGGRDAETSSDNPFFEFNVDKEPKGEPSIYSPPTPGRYLFQSKFHRTTDTTLTDARRRVLSDFRTELMKNVLPRQDDDRVNFFVLVTNVPSSADSIRRAGKVARELTGDLDDLYASIWWQERVIAHLDQLPRLWTGFPQLFAGNKPPSLAQIVTAESGTPRAVRLAVSRQFDRDRNIKFRQIDLDRDLSRLFVDLDVSLEHLSPSVREQFHFSELRRIRELGRGQHYRDLSYQYLQSMRGEDTASALAAILFEPGSPDSENAGKTILSRVLLEGGPGQGKSTITQMGVQIYRQQLLEKTDLDPQGRWVAPKRVRIPFRIDLGSFAEWLVKNSDGSVEQYIIEIIEQDSGGEEITVGELHTLVEGTPVLLVFDGLDEIGSDELRDTTLGKISDCVDRFKEDLGCDLKVIITTRPPAVAGRRDLLSDYSRLTVTPMNPGRIGDYLDRWLSVQSDEKVDRERIRESFERRQQEPHVEALARNPMQLSVLLHFIRLKGEAFPDHRAELYRDYFQIVIDRDVEKSPELRQHRQIIERLHQLLGYKIHALTEAELADGSIERSHLLEIVEDWLRAKGHEIESAPKLFKIGEERLGLIVISKGEGEDARYGFEIQPIREYFAAAYINEQSVGDAHMAFEEMVRRPFWREVALFLAGLRRPNEKADLVVRLKTIDAELDQEWRLDGRSMTLQLLLEGALSDPHYVFSDALDFVMDLLDPRLVRAQNEPDGYTSSVATLINRGGIKRDRERLLRILKDFSENQDPGVTFRLYRVASKVLERETVTKAILAHKAVTPLMRAELRLTLPYVMGLEIINEAKISSYWADVPDYIWAKEWMNAAFIDSSATALPGPYRLHQPLVDHFSMMNVLPRILRRPDKSILNVKSNWAAWKLVSNQLTLQLVAEYPDLIERESGLNEMIVDSFEDHSAIEFSGLKGPQKTLVEYLLSLTQDIGLRILKNDKSALPTFVQEVPELIRNIQLPLMDGWLAHRCSAILLRVVVAAQGARSGEPPSFSAWNLGDYIRRDKNLMALARELQILYRGTQESSGTSFAFGVRFLYQGIRPTYIRLRPGDEPVSIVRLLEDSVKTGTGPDYDWFTFMPHTTTVIRPLTDRCKDCLSDMLEAISEWNMETAGIGKPLLTPRMHQILGLVRKSDERSILRGALYALSTSKFIRSAGSKAIARVLRLDRDGEVLARDLFSGRDLSEDELRIVTEVALRILDSPDEFPFAVVTRSALHTSEHSKIELSPLLEIEEDLNIRVVD